MHGTQPILNTPKIALVPRVLMLVLATALVPGIATAHPPALEPASSGGLPELDRALARLSTHRRLLIVAAHPDDEDTSLLTYVARGLGGESAYLSLSRGEGGQNLIGPELGTGLGILRSRELLAARRIDGARQYFTRAYDFGYTRSLDETFGKWPRALLLEDAMRIVRRFKPQVLVAIFPPSALAAHGQHWSSGEIAPELFERSADRAAFPQLDREGLAPWKVETFFRSTFFDRESTTLELPLGTIEPFRGRSILQLALESRSQHRCQDMGLELPLGDAKGRIAWVAGAGGVDSEDLFAGIDTRTSAIADPLPEGEVRRSVAARLGRVGEIAAAARHELSAVEPHRTVEPLLEIVRLLRSVDEDLGAAPGEATEAGARRQVREQVRELVREKLDIAQEAVATAAQVLLDAVAEGEAVVPGGRLGLRSMLWNAGPFDVGQPEIVAVGPGGWRIVADEAPPAPEEDPFFSGEVTYMRILTVEVPSSAEATVPYFLRRPRRGDLYDWEDVSPEVRGRPFDRPPLALRFAFTVGGVPIEIEREVVHRYRDQARGEIRRPLRVVPRIEVAVEPELVVWPVGRREATVRAEVRSNVAEPVRARLELTLPDGWPAVEAVDVVLDEPLERRSFDIVVRAPEALEAGRPVLEIAALTEDGERFTHSYPLIDYEHIRPTPLPRPARVEISAGDIRLPSLDRLGYIRGASDRVPEQLLEIGLPLELLSAAELADAELAAYDAIVVGARAYETDPALVKSSSRLLDYVRGGGLLIVQYQQYQFVRGGFAPYPLEIRRPHDRITDEASAVRMLEPEHPVFRIPNRIGDADWDGWVQERGLYFAGTWDDAYRPLLALRDPEGDEQQGGLLVAELGEGTYVYTGLAFFRQLPAGVPGAFRLFANLLSLGR